MRDAARGEEELAGAQGDYHYAERMLELQREWLEEAEELLSGGSSRSSPPRSGSGTAPPG